MSLLSGWLCYDNMLIARSVLLSQYAHGSVLISQYAHGSVVRA